MLKINLLFFLFWSIGHVFSYEIALILSHNGPVVMGANITFTAELSDSLNQPPTGKFAFEWHDNAHPRHTNHVMDTTNTTELWNVSYPPTKYSPGEYEVSVKVFQHKYLYIEVAHQKIRFNVTETLNGNMDIQQNKQKDTNVFVSNAGPVKHTIKLSQADYDFISTHATSVLTFWFVDCVYYGFSTDNFFTFLYSEEKAYNVEALMIASFDEPPPTTSTTSTTTTTPATTTTTPATTNTTTSTISTTTHTTTTVKPDAASNNSSTISSVSTHPSPTPKVSSFRSDLAYSPASTPHIPTSPSVPSNSVAHYNLGTSTDEISANQQSTLPDSVIPALKQMTQGTVFPQKRHVTRSINSVLNTTKDSPFLHNIASYACLNSSFVPPDPNKTYGYFRKQIVSKAPITKVIVKGNNWLQFGDILHLNISCNGSGKFQHCAKIKIGAHNITGNETCSSPLERDVCDFTLTHYFREANTYTYIIIIMNDVSKVVTPAVITMYKVTVQPQLSVIVVPVTCSLLAIIIIVFGVAYYVQSQNRYTVEVADFDFGQANDMEYKSFYERLREDLSNMFSRSGDFVEHADAVPRRSKYDNMEES